MLDRVDDDQRGSIVASLHTATQDLAVDGLAYSTSYSDAEARVELHLAIGWARQIVACILILGGGRLPNLVPLTQALQPG